MATIEIGQRLPARGVRGAREAVARESHAAAVAAADETERLILARVKEAFYEAWFATSAIDILTRTQATFGETAEVARARYASGASPQRDVLRAQMQLARLEEQLASLRAERLAAIGELQALVDRQALELAPDDYPAEVRALALAPLPAGAFTAVTDTGSLGQRLPSLAELHRVAVARRPSLRALEHEEAAAREAVRLAEAERFPEMELMLGYGVRWGHPDLLSAAIRVPLPVFAERRQRLAVVEARHELAAAAAAGRAGRNETRAELARRHAMLVRRREQIRLLLDGVVPHARTSIETASAAYATGRGELPEVLEAHATLFAAEMELARLLADFGRELAQLELAIGTDLLREERT